MSEEPVRAMRRRRRRRGRELARYAVLGGLGALVLAFFLPEMLAGIERLIHTHPLAFLTAAAVSLLAVGLQALFIYWIDRHEKEPALLLLGCFIWGAAVATVLSVLLEQALESWLSPRTSDLFETMRIQIEIGAPIIEETTKGLALLLVFLLFRREFHNVLDGLVYGAFIGLGFAWVEDATYLTWAGASGGAGELLELFWVRCLVHGMAHSCYTALTGCGFGLFRVLKGRRIRWAAVPAFFLLAILAHHLWNAHVDMFLDDGAPVSRILLVSAPLAALALAGPFILLLAIIVILCWRQERRILSMYLDGEPSLATKRRTESGSRLRRFLFDRRFRRSWHFHRLRQELASLAFLKWHLDRDPAVDWSPDEDAEVAKLRERIRRRRERLS